MVPVLAPVLVPVLQQYCGSTAAIVQPKNNTQQRGTDAWSCANHKGWQVKYGKWPGPLALRVCFNWWLWKNEKMSIIFPKKNAIFRGFFIFQKRPQIAGFAKTVCFLNYGVLGIGKPIGNQWHVLLVGLCGFSVGIGSCTSLRQTCQAWWEAWWWPKIN